MATIDERVAKAIQRNLIDFGYEGLTLEEVKASYQKALDGKPKENIIDMMVESQLKANGML